MSSPKKIFKKLKKGSKKIGNVLTGGALFGEKEKSAAPQEIPEIVPPPVIPLPDDEEVKKARRRSLNAQYRRRGRQSTILSDAYGSKLGG